jgi:hypothetical protein
MNWPLIRRDMACYITASLCHYPEGITIFNSENGRRSAGIASRSTYMISALQTGIPSDMLAARISE